MTYSLDQIRAFIAVAEELHFGRAAERLRMTQPPLSRQIQRLEGHIGVRLFERNNRRVELTEAGRAFLDESRRVVAIADAAPLVARTAAEGSTGLLRLGFTATGAYSVLGDALNRMHEELPGVTVELHEMVTRDQLAALHSGEIDLALGRPGFNEDEFRSRLLAREGLVAALPESHSLAKRRSPVTAEDLAGERIIMHDPVAARYFYDLTVRMLPVSRWRFSHTVSQIVTMVALVAAGRGIALVPESAARLGFAGVAFARVATAVAEPVEMHVIWRRDETRPIVGRVLEQLPRR